MALRVSFKRGCLYSRAAENDYSRKLRRPASIAEGRGPSFAGLWPFSIPEAVRTIRPPPLLVHGGGGVRGAGIRGLRLRGTSPFLTTRPLLRPAQPSARIVYSRRSASLSQATCVHTKNR